MIRLDKALLAQGLVRSRSEAQTLIEAGQVLADGSVVTKPSQAVSEQSCLTIIGPRAPYVSRGGIKLAAALQAFGISVRGRTVLDVGASTGGFTDCLLQLGAAHVTAIDAGHGQMALEIAQDSRVDSREGVNARFLNPDDFLLPFDLVTVDVSFISLTQVLPALAPLLHPLGDMILLIKPQFEVGREMLGKQGVVRSSALQEQAAEKVRLCASKLALTAHGQMPSPITGASGNKEFLLWLKRAC